MLKLAPLIELSHSKCFILISLSTPWEKYLVSALFLHIFFFLLQDKGGGMTNDRLMQQRLHVCYCFL
jgi:hypothetical protein